ncbi:YpoC family protein [Neobacillus pocheonensis]|uniref:YpoC family protein n=1 Tax=Neobacillus pocheonensis TaxID=363869 RepID=UPI003D282602
MDKQVANIVEEWSKVREKLDELFRCRDMKNTKEWMEKGIDLFIQFLLKTNAKSYFQGPIPYDQLEVKPVNIEERLAFIMNRPNLYHSYRQLIELMIEQEKQFVKWNVIKKSSKPNG